MAELQYRKRLIATLDSPKTRCIELTTKVINDSSARRVTFEDVRPCQ
jgi:hypothetical protein